MKSLLHVSIGLLAIVMIASCTTFKISGILISTNIPPYETVGEFEIEIPVLEFLGSSGATNVYNISSDAMDTKIFDTIQREIQKFSGDAAVNVIIEYRTSFSNRILNRASLFLVAPANAQVSGVVVKFQ